MGLVGARQLLRKCPQSSSYRTALFPLRETNTMYFMRGVAGSKCSYNSFWRLVYSPATFSLCTSCTFCASGKDLVGEPHSCTYTRHTHTHTHTLACRSLLPDQQTLTLWSCIPCGFTFPKERQTAGEWTREDKFWSSDLYFHVKQEQGCFNEQQQI